jgi:beta-glucanase (GH16 family)
MPLRRALLSALAFIPLAGCVSAPSAPSGYRLVWSDEFNRDGRPDPANWSFERGFERNREAQFYQPENAFVKGGVLVIEARREAVPNPRYEAGSSDWKRARSHSEYTSASLLTRGLQEWTYGRFELRARIDTRAGIWPAWWTLGVEREWPHNGEIDIMEFYKGKLLANVAWGTPKRWNAKWDSTSVPLEELGGEKWTTEFHVWRMDWTPDHIRLYVDDRLLNETRVEDARNPDGFLPFRQPHYMILNVAVGGDNGGDPSKTEFPSRMEVDWVRVYQPIAK